MTRGSGGCKRRSRSRSPAPCRSTSEPSESGSSARGTDEGRKVQTPLRVSRLTSFIAVRPKIAQPSALASARSGPAAAAPAVPTRRSSRPGIPCASTYASRPRSSSNASTRARAGTGSAEDQSTESRPQRYARARPPSRGTRRRIASGPPVPSDGATPASDGPPEQPPTARTAGTAGTARTARSRNRTLNKLTARGQFTVDG